jgi:release factor glutamine methyltransferase
LTGAIETVLASAAAVLRDGGIDTPMLDARLLLCHATGLSHERIIALGREPLAAEDAARLEAYVLRRLSGEPVARIRGTREFYGRDFRIDAHTLDPRPDTETLIGAALDLVARQGWQDRPLTLLDLGTGSGCILLTLLAELPNAQGVGTDLSEGALRLAAENARRLGLAARARFIAADWFDGVQGRFDLILSNPPYIARADIAGLAREVAAHDPGLALDGGVDGLAAYRRIAGAAGAHLAAEGQILVEIGADQAEDVMALFRAAGLGDGARMVRDSAGRPRCVLAEAGPGRGKRPPKSPKISLEKPNVRARLVSAE